MHNGRSPLCDARAGWWPDVPPTGLFDDNLQLVVCVLLTFGFAMLNPAFTPPLSQGVIGLGIPALSRGPEAF